MKNEYELRSEVLGELKALMSVMPATPRQVEKICETIEQTLYRHPEIEQEIKRYLIKRWKKTVERQKWHFYL